MTSHRPASYAEVHLNLIRGGAALIVMLGHARGLFFASLTAASQHIPATGGPGRVGPAVTMGFQAVMIFFTLSGYLVGGSVTKLLSQDRWSWSEYLIKRLTRLWIVLIPAIIIGATIDYVGLHALAKAGSIYGAPLGQEYVRGGVTLQSISAPNALGNVFFLQTFLVPTIGTNIALWSLANEFWYYLIFPLLLIALSGRFTIASRAAAALCAMLAGWLLGQEALWLFLPWLLGAATSLVPPMRSWKVARLATFAGMIGMVPLFVVLKSHDLDYRYDGLVLGLMTSALITFSRSDTPPCTSAMYAAIAGFSSRISYSLYLFHLPLLILICNFANNPWHRWDLTPLNLLKFAACAAAVVLWSWLMYRTFEARTDAARDRLLDAWRQYAAK